MESDNTCIEIKRVKLGRPKSIEPFNKKEYFKEYYEKNKEKYVGDYHCKVCNVIF